MEATITISYDEERISLDELLNFLRTQDGIDSAIELQKLMCEFCGWKGFDSDLAVTYTDNPAEPGDVTPIASCPQCGNVYNLEELDA